ncbi:TIGR04282 family arsenosugar biosynthesis glycosyltransferase [Roseofilum casamattae]|uniref:TIGR04282 family arsenosugar biosynthesis glycosyltransferase n=1 Tax=Roseofilum casamattae BLCC-M143 TaxID=3022442 RepID=A0ABT7BTZ2_9CYAN|nr:TIGR04282 family arsenosugar biosynthesis glycosyltransferase [Roseofilum casamattae]MDJ1182653.1 TIGR04282 family arsenosugar biosynthesis glycosyltransferase [Roseofilum casamattae BLCC-M143]
MNDFLDLSSLPSAQCQLLLYTRYPERGRAKTRLIPALGVEGAMQMHRCLAEWAIAQVRSLQTNREIPAIIYFTGATREMMQHWLGSDLVYRTQGSGDLGERLHTGFGQGFAAGMSRIAAMGTDCPSLTPERLQEAFAALGDRDLVLGPARDGGYYLIGLSRAVPELFQGIDWGTSEVFAQTMAIANRLGLSYHHLPMLPDIDRPEDLQYLPPQLQAEANSSDHE